MDLLCIPLIFPHTVKEEQIEYKIVFTDFLPGYDFIPVVWTGSAHFNAKFRHHACAQSSRGRLLKKSE